MHPMERLRSVARASGVGAELLVQESAAALAALGHDPAALVTACRRLVERHPAVGPMWWLASRVLCAPDPVAEAWKVSADLEADGTAGGLAAALPEDATVVLVGWPELALDGLRRRGDIEVLLVSGGGESAGLSRRLSGAGLAVEDVPDAGAGAAVLAADVVVLEASAAGPHHLLAVAGSHPTAAVAGSAGVPVWALVGAGRRLPASLWTALEGRLERSSLPAWERGYEPVPLRLCDQLFGPSGPWSGAEDEPDGSWPMAAELLKPLL